MDGIIVSDLEPVRRRRSSRFILIGAGAVAASLIAGLLVFSWLSAMGDTPTPGSDAPPDVHLSAPHHFRF
jgi:hypothetical protein